MTEYDRVVDAEVNPYDPEVQRCPVETYHRLRASTPVYYSTPADAYIVTGYDLVEAVLRDPARYSNDCPRDDAPSAVVEAEVAAIRKHGWPHVSTLATQDPPLHTHYRAVVTPFFSPTAIRAYEARAREVCDALLDGLGDRPLDFVGEVAEPLPIQVTVELMGLDPEMVESYRQWTKDATVAVGNRVDDDRRIQAEKGLVEMQRHFHGRLQAARRDPGADYFSALVAARIPDGDGERPLTDEEMISLSRQLFVGGIETTTKLLAELVKELAEKPELYHSLKEDPSGVARLVEETLRLSSPAQGLPRRATVDTELAGVSIPAGSTVITMYAAANRDPDMFENPDLMDVGRRNVRRHLAFGKGAHFCLGAPISRMEAQVVLEGLVARFSRLRLVADRNDFAYEPSFILRGLKELWVQLTPESETEKTSVD